MTRLSALPLFLLAACSLSHGRVDDTGTSDGGSANPDSAALDAGATCVGSPALRCVESCASDFDVGVECRDGRFVCPDRSFDVALCGPGCDEDELPANCRCTDSGVVCEHMCPAGVPARHEPCAVEGDVCTVRGGECGIDAFCSCDSGQWNCAVAEPSPACYCASEPREGGPCAVGEDQLCGECCPTLDGPGWAPLQCIGGFWTAAACPEIVCPPLAECPVDTSTLLGRACSEEARVCGSDCCSNGVRCSDGLWEALPDVRCACEEYPCGSGSCSSAQYCHLQIALDDGGLYSCAELPEGCADCSCIPLRGQLCEMIDGRPLVRERGRGDE